LDDAGKKEINPYLVISGIGSLCYLAFVMSVVFGGFTLRDAQTAGQGTTYEVLAAVVFVLTLSAPNVLGFLKLKGHCPTTILIKQNAIPAPLFTLPLLLVTACLQLPVFFLPLVGGVEAAYLAGIGWLLLTSVAWMAFGFSTAVLIVLWGSHWATLFFQFPRRQVMLSMCLVPCLAGIVAYALITLAAYDAPLQLAGIQLVCLLASLAANRYSEARLTVIETSDYFGYREFRVKMHQRAHFFRPLMVGFCVAAALQLLISRFDVQSVVVSLPLLVSAAAAAFALMNVKNYIPIPLFDKLVYSALCICFALLPIVSDASVLVILILILFLAFLFFVQNWCAIAQIAIKWEFNTIYTCAVEALFLMLGWLIGTGILLGLSWLGAPYGESTALISFAVVVLFVVMIALMPYGNDFWDELDDFMNGIERVPLHEQVVAPTITAKYKDKCAFVASRHNLSAREREVFALLARGRDTNIIARELVISPHTARTHIYHIYRKIGVRTQQDLIDLVEKTG
jgi:DNA-binding CsgD family transcriptional regulator